MERREEAGKRGKVKRGQDIGWEKGWKGENKERRGKGGREEGWKEGRRRGKEGR